MVALGGGSLIDDASWALVAARAVTIYLEVPFETIWTRIRKLSGRAPGFWPFLATTSSHSSSGDGRAMSKR